MINATVEFGHKGQTLKGKVVYRLDRGGLTHPVVLTVLVAHKTYAVQLRDAKFGDLKGRKALVRDYGENLVIAEITAQENDFGPVEVEDQTTHRRFWVGYDRVHYLMAEKWKRQAA